jgi:tRNA nucleotidyltransferase (CCA-adding enzyme)
MSKTYLVGGAVRDALMEIACNDLDYVVCGSTPQEMLDNSFKEVGATFPVFLCPETGDEYALARKEYSTGDGYKDFKCSFGKEVTLEEDLLRRDLTCNAIAIDTFTEELIDPYNGIQDIKNKILRHTSESFRDDPVRVLRLARFYARFGSEWTIAPETTALCVKMYKEGMLYSLTPERVFLELEKALKTQQPSLFINTLHGFGLFPILESLESIPQREDHHPEGNVGTHVRMAMDYAARTYGDPEIVFSVMMHDCGKYESYERFGNAFGHEEYGVPYVEATCKQWKIPNNYRDLAVLVTKHHGKIHGTMGRGSNSWTRPKSIMKLFQQTNALVKPERFEKILKCCVADARGRGGTPEQIEEFEAKPYPQKEYLLECLQAARMVNTKEVSLPAIKKGKSGMEIGEAIRVARIDAIRAVQRKWKEKTNERS